VSDGNETWRDKAIPVPVECGPARMRSSPEIKFGLDVSILHNLADGLDRQVRAMKVRRRMSGWSVWDEDSRKLEKDVADFYARVEIIQDRVANLQPHEDPCLETWRSEVSGKLDKLAEQAEGFVRGLGGTS
jgi:hypothetical protein